MLADGPVSETARQFRTLFGWGVQEFRVLRTIRDNPGVTFTDLVAATRLQRSLVSRILVRLVKAGMAQREGSERDARRYFLSVTPQGAEICGRADRFAAELEALLLNPLSREDRRKLKESIDALIDWAADGYKVELRRRFPDV